MSNVNNPAVNDWDKQLLLALNGQWSERWDTVWLWITGQQHWWWFYLLLVIWLFYRLPWRKALVLVVLTIVLIGFNDQFINLVKHWTGRLRPCNEPELRPLLHVLKCTTQKSFFSGHAANSFLLASLMQAAVGDKWGRWPSLVLFAWATASAYSRIYVGVHYPSDVLTGALEGILVGMVAGYLFRKKFSG